ncbi:MAG: GNAT family N-acetyltransferase [Bacteroidota bacterium]|nr:GNAT family N-acetyltransferase [Bacteroidota bacterium]
MQTVRVQLKTDENNLRSRKAIEKTGGKFEGILRNDMLRDNGTKRNSAIYSILDGEWEEVKAKLTQLYNTKKISSAETNHFLFDLLSFQEKKRNRGLFLLYLCNSVGNVSYKFTSFKIYESKITQVQLHF